MMNVPFLDLKAVNAAYRADLLDRLTKVVDSGWYIRGDELACFESEFAAYCGVSHAIGAANGLDALWLVLEAWKYQGRLRLDDEVIVPANTYIATILAVIRAGLKPVLVEPDPLTYNLDPAAITRAITPRTRVVLPVHLYGRMADMPRICSVAARYRLLILEDAAQAHGACVNGRRAGAWGDAAAFSFYPGKNLGALGDGGIVTTSDADTANVVRALGNYGSHEKYVHEIEGVNSRLDEMQAALLRVKLPRLDQSVMTRRDIAATYLAGIQHPLLRLPIVGGNLPVDTGSHVWHLFVLRCEQRDALRLWLEQQDIQTLIHYPTPPYRQPALAGRFDVHLPITDEIHRSVLSLPLWPGLSDEQIQHVVSACNAFPV